MSNNFHLQLYRGTTQQNNAYTGPAGELTVDTTLSKLRLHDGSTAGGVEIGGMPTGSIIPYAGSTAPAGYLLCDGSAISRSTYSALFAIIGTTYGEGDGNSTFNLPDTQAQWICGANGTNYLVGEYKTAGLPNITGYYVGNCGENGECQGALKVTNQRDNAWWQGSVNVARENNLEFNASWSNSIYGNAETVRPRSVVTNFCIKY